MSIPGVAPTSRLFVAFALVLAGACRDPATDAAKPTASPSAPTSAPTSPAAVADAKPTAPTPAAITTTAPTPAATAEPGVGPSDLPPLSPIAREQFFAGGTDAPIPVEIHYVQSNETRHDLFAPFIAGRRGAYVGVGSDQNYTMMAVARSEVAFLLDIDYRVVDLHRMYEVLIERSETPRDLVDAWHARNEDRSRSALAEAFGELPERERSRILRGFMVGRETVYRHLERVIARTRDGAPSTWLSDPEHYAHIRAMYTGDRVRMMPGDLTGSASLQTAAAACKALGVPVSVLYVSNAEEYFKYAPQFVANIEAMPFDDGGMLLRTIYNKKWAHADLWAYQVQPLADFRARLADRKNRSRNPMLRYADLEGKLDKQTGHVGLTLVGMPKA